MANDNPFSPASGGYDSPFSPASSTIDDNPFVPASLPSSSGDTTLEQLAVATAPTMPQQTGPTGPTVLYSPTTNKMFVNGALFDADDAQSALDSIEYLRGQPMQAPEGYDWQDVSPQNYSNYIKNINEPGFGTLMARNFEIGGSNLKLLAGRGMQFLGAEETGQEWVNEAVNELYKNQPYQREFTNIEFGDDKSHGAIDWFVANLAQQGPNLIESIIVAIAGAGAGAVAGGGANPFTAAGGAIMTLMGKKKVQQEILKAANKYMKGQALTNGERKLLREAAGFTGAAAIKNPKAFFVGPGGSAMTAKQFLKQSADDALLTGAKSSLKAGRKQGMAGGAFLGSLGGSYGMGVADIYGEVRETGVGDRGTAAGMAIPYAALETIPEFLLAGRILGLDGSMLSPKGMAKGGIGKRALKGFGVGGTLEGLTEAGQEVILLGSTGQMSDGEAVKRLINSFAAGFGVGGPIGGLANLKRGKSTNVLDPVQPADPAPVEGEVVDSPKPSIPSAPEALPAPAETLALPAPEPFPTNDPNFVAGPEGPASTEQVQQQGELFPPEADLGQAEANIQAQARLVLEQNPGILSLTDEQFEAYNPFNPNTTGNMADLGIRSDDVFRVIQDIRGQGRAPTFNENVTAENQEIVTPAQPENNTVEQAFTQMELPGVTDTAQAAIGVAQQNPEVQQTAIGQQLLEQAQVKEAQAREEAAIARREAEEARIVAERERQFNEAVRQRQEQQIKELENARIEQILAENERLTQENVQLKAPPVPQVPTEPQQQTLPGFGVPYGLKRLQRGQEAQQAQPTPVQKPDTRQMELPLFNSEAELDAMNTVRLKNIAKSLGVTGYSNVKKPVLLDKIKQKLREEGYAIQERSPTPVDVQEQSQVGETIPVGDTQEREVAATPRNVERLRATQDSTTERSQEEVSQAVPVERQDEQQVAQPTNQAQQEGQQDSTEDTSVTDPNPVPPSVAPKEPTPQRDATYASAEEAWDDMGVTNTAFDRLPKQFRDEFTASVDAGTITYEEARRIYKRAVVAMDASETNQLNDNELLSDAIMEFESGTHATVDDFEYAAYIIMDYAFFNENSNVNKSFFGQPPVRKQAQAFLEHTEFDSFQQQTLNNAFVDAANTNAIFTGTAGGKETPRMMYAAHNDLLKDIKATFTRMPKWYTAQQEAVAAETATQAEQESVSGEPINRDSLDDKTVEQVSKMLEQRIDSHIREVPTVFITNRDGASKERTAIENMFANANPEFMTARGKKLKEFFTPDGRLKLRKSSTAEATAYVPTTKELTKEEQAQATKDLKEARAAAKLREQERLAEINQMMGEDDRSIFGAYDDSFEDGMYFRADTGERIKDPLPRGKINLIVKKLLKGLRAKPTVTVVKNYEDLRRNYPKLFERAAAGRADFGTVNAVGYSVGDQIIIFSDFVKSEEHLKFVLAHETLGHFGFRAFMPRDRLNTIMRDIYKEDPHIRAVADRNMAAGMEYMEAVEEALADAAAYIDASVIKKFWYKVKNTLNKLGFTFEDDMARYLISQSRRNLRTGGRGVVSAAQLKQRLKELADETVYGRYSLESDRANLASTLFSQFAMGRNSGAYGSFTGFRRLFEKTKRGEYQLGDVGNLVGELLEEVQSIDNMATRNEGLSNVFKIFQKQQARVKRLHAKYAKLTAFSHTANWIKKDGPTVEELERAGELLAHAALYKGRTTTEEAIRNAPNLFIVDDANNIVRDEDAIRKVIAAGEVTREDFENGFSVELELTADGEVNTGGAEVYSPNFPITDNIWRIYQEQRAVINEAALDVVEANLGASLDQKNEVLQIFAEIKGAAGETANKADLKTLDRIMQEYTRLYKENAVEEGSGMRYNPDSIERAENFIREITGALFKQEKVNDWTTGKKDELAAQFQGEQYRDIIDGLQSLKNINLSEKQAYRIRNGIENVYMLDVRNSNAEFLGKRTIMGAYVPFTRRGKYQVVMKAVDANGNAVRLDEMYKSSMPYFQVNTRSDARLIVDDLVESFNDREFEVLNEDQQNVKVRFVPEYSVARQSQPLQHSINMNEFMDVLMRLNINVTPKERENIILALTKQGERARKSLQRSGVAGWDKDVIRSIAEHVETAGHVAGKVFYRHRLNRVMLNNDFWKGDPAKLKRLHDEMLEAEKGGNPAAIKVARQKYDEYASMYQYSADVGKGKTVRLYGAKEENGTRKSKDVTTEGRGETYREKAKRMVAWYSDAANIDQSTEDVLSGEVGSRFKLWAVLFQLGGSFATAFINLVSIPVNANPYLAFYNERRGYGGGFGLSKATAALTRAANNMKNGKLAEFEYMEQVAESKTLQGKHNISQDEAQALYKATAEGVLQAAQFNALVGTARGGVKSNRIQSGIKAWMSFFSYTEQMNRRTTFLAAYRLERDRQLAAGTDLLEAQQIAAEFGNKAVNTSQGEYAMYNRPEMARGNVLQYVFMYKQFVIITVELMKGMDNKGRLYMLTLMLLMSGLKGVPFADDLMDLIDTLAQKFGIKMGSIEKELTILIDEMVPGLSPYAMRGILDTTSGATFSTRLGFGDLIPLSGAFKAGADPWREATNFFGPIWSGATGAAMTAGHIVRYGAETIGLADDVTTLEDILRTDNPVAAVRALADSFYYAHDGRITNTRGSVVSNEAPLHVILTRALGFYPSAATVQNDIVRMNKSSAEYVKSIKQQYVQEYVKASLDGNDAEINRIIEMVEDHNASHRGTEFEFRNFVKGANRSLRYARMPTVLRYRKTAPKNTREKIDDLMRIYGVDIDDIN